eukprot:3881433-Amphidinium_carterae.2
MDKVGASTRVNKKKNKSKSKNVDEGESAKKAPVPLSQEETAALMESQGYSASKSMLIISPFEVHFSQELIRPEFQDGTLVDTTREEVMATLCSPLEQGSVPSDRTWWLLTAPFSHIEAIQWQCKLRDDDGSIKTNAEGAELYSDKEWYSLDNRRLYCLQHAATKLWPDEVMNLTCSESLGKKSP